MKKLSRTLAALSAVVVALPLMSSCTGTPTGAGTAAASSAPAAASAGQAAVDTSQAVQLTGYLLGDTPAGMPDVLAKLNEMLKKDVNATMTFNYIGWGEMSSKYATVLAAGADIDWIYTAPWCYYSIQAAKGAFREITMDDAQKYMPKHSAALPQVAWNQCKINGKIYMIPTSTPDQKVAVAVIRGDILKKYNLATPTKFSDLTDYFEAVKQNETDMIPLDMDKQYDFSQAAGALISEQLPPYNDILYSTGGGSGIIYEYDLAKPTLVTQFDEPFATGFIAGYKAMKAWYDAGYINQDVFGNTTRSQNTFVQGRSATALGNSQDMQTVISTAQVNGWDPVIISELFKTGKSAANAYSNNGVAIAQSSKNPERAMMALDYMMEDPTYATLLYYGIEGTNYVKTADGKLDLPEGVTPDSNTYTVEAAGFWFITKTIMLPSATWPQSYIDFVQKDVPGYLIDDPLAAFTPDTDSIKTQVANVSSAITQYGSQLQVGSASDVDAAWATLKDKVQAAGQSDMMTELSKQLDAFYASNAS